MKPPISQLSRAEQDKVRKQWKDDQRKSRERKRATEEILNFTPESLDTTPIAVAPLSPIAQLQPDPPNIDAENRFEQQPRASSTPLRARRLRWKRERAKLRSDMFRMKREMEAAKKETERFRKRLERLSKNRTKSQENAKSTTQGKRGAKKLSVHRKEKVVEFLCRDENSRLLPGKKDTVTKDKNRQQRRVLINPLKELHTSFNSVMDRSHMLSYRQFVRYCPFYVTQPKASDRNTCACLDHENVRLLSEQLKQKGQLKTSSVSELLSAIICSPDNKDCMYRICTKCCFNDVEVSQSQPEEMVTWSQWVRKPVTEEQRTFMNFVKETQNGTCRDMLELFNLKLDGLAKHHFNWLHQATGH